jgi:hypothetical protein
MIRLLLAAALLTPAAALAQSFSPETAAAAAERGLSGLDVRAALAPEANEPVLQPALTPSPFRSSAKLGAELGRVDLAGQLDKNFYVLNERLGARAWDLGVATDAGFKKYFLTFTDKARATRLGAVGSLSDLRGPGVDIRVDAATVYNFKVKINIFSPTRGSTLLMTPAQGAAGPEASVKTGAVLDAVAARATRVSISGEEYWFFYGRDALPDGSGFAATRSFLIVRENGLSSKAWPLAEAALKPGAASVVDLGGVKAALTRTSDGALIVNAAD